VQIERQEQLLVFGVEGQFVYFSNKEP